MERKSSFLPKIPADKITTRKASGNDYEFFELLTEPLHAEMYSRQNFDFIQELSQGQQLFLSYDYVRMQVMQGGFIQFIQNGYVSLLLPMPGWLTSIGANEMAQLLDDVLKAYVTNIDVLERETTVEEFAQLYDQLPEFAILDEEFNSLDESTIHTMAVYAAAHLEEFVAF
ncbi:DMP19 family protein [Taibaiella soli]|nr:DUF4375 domain-containing protein [Taibaiella soli]